MIGRPDAEWGEVGGGLRGRQRACRSELDNALPLPYRPLQAAEGLRVSSMPLPKNNYGKILKTDLRERGEGA